MHCDFLKHVTDNEFGTFTTSMKYYHTSIQSLLINIQSAWVRNNAKKGELDTRVRGSLLVINRVAVTHRY